MSKEDATFTWHPPVPATGDGPISKEAAWQIIAPEVVRFFVPGFIDQKNYMVNHQVYEALVIGDALAFEKPGFTATLIDKRPPDHLHHNREFAQFRLITIERRPLQEPVKVQPVNPND
jgi:hypothetical protein